MSHNIADQKIRWFNAHTEACGYLNGLKEISPKEGQSFKPFWTTTFCMLEGNPESPRKTYFSINIVNPKVVDILKPYINQLNADGSRVFVTARISDIAVEPFVYGVSSQRAGELGVNWQANLISLIALKVGDMTIELKKETSTDFGVSAQPTASINPNEENAKSLFALPLIVNLDKDDPGFNETKSRLKDSGYRWNSEKLAWYLASVALGKTDPVFDEKYNALKAAGYVFSSAEKMWNMPSTPKQQSNTNRQSSRQNGQQYQANHVR